MLVELYIIAPTTHNKETTMIISYTDTEAFYDGILSLVKRGIMFTAHDQSLKIELTGGY